MITDVRLSEQAKKDLRRIPAFIRDKLLAWVDAVEHEGLEQVRRVPGYHDEPLMGPRFGQRSVRLNRAYRAIYRLRSERVSNGIVEFITIEEVIKHDY